jgi:hypothetical membrane protein
MPHPSQGMHGRQTGVLVGVFVPLHHLSFSFLFFFLFVFSGLVDLNPRLTNKEAMAMIYLGITSFTFGVGGVGRRNLSIVL